MLKIFARETDVDGIVFTLFRQLVIPAVLTYLVTWVLPTDSLIAQTWWMILVIFAFNSWLLGRDWVYMAILLPVLIVLGKVADSTE